MVSMETGYHSKTIFRDDISIYINEFMINLNIEKVYFIILTFSIKIKLNKI
jgi:hypothetical protein